MPNFDAGRYFLTVLAPLNARSIEVDGVAVTLEETLARLPTALQSPATVARGENSPFARNRRNHLARFAILDDVVYNGAPPVDPVVGRLTGRDPLTPQPVDSIAPGFLLFTAELDAVLDDGAPLPESLSTDEQDAVRDAYARLLWETMGDELRAVFAFCHDFDAVADADADGFARYIARTQVETTMPFNDYYTESPSLPALPLAALLAVVLAPLAVTALALAGVLLGTAQVPLLGLLVDWAPHGTLFAGGLITAVAAWLAYRFVLDRGARPLPPATDATLPDVLKALHVQRHFADFAIASQGADPSVLHEAFGTFLAKHRLDDVDIETQAPGTIPGTAGASA
jgi:hypothetical protein